MPDDQPSWFEPCTGRRPFIAGLGMAVGAIVVPVGTDVVGAEEHVTDLAVPAWWALWGDTDGDESFDTVMHRENPTDRFCDDGDGRENAIHITSSGTTTRDYAMSLINLEDISISLGGAVSGTRIAFEYFEGPDHTGVAPGDVYVILRTEDDTEDHVTVAFQHHDDEEDPGDLICETLADNWMEHSVSSYLDGTGGPWRATTVEKDALADGQGLRELAVALRTADPFNSPVDEFGEQTDLLAVGVGVGETHTGGTIDLYLDELSIDDEVTRGFSATIPMNLSIEQLDNGAVLFNAAPTQVENGLVLSDLNLASVRLSPYSPAAPPVTDGVMVRGIQVQDDVLRGVFPASGVNEVFDEGEQTVFVVGEFDVEPTVRFVAVGDVDISG